MLPTNLPVGSSPGSAQGLGQHVRQPHRGGPTAPPAYNPLLDFYGLVEWACSSGDKAVGAVVMGKTTGKENVNNGPRRDSWGLPHLERGEGMVRMWEQQSILRKPQEARVIDH